MLPRPRAHLPGRHPCQRAFALTRRRGDHGSQQREARRHLHCNERSVRTRPNFGEEEWTGVRLSKREERGGGRERSSPEACVVRWKCSRRSVLWPQLQRLAPSWLPRRQREAPSAMAQAGASCSVRIDRTLRPVEAGVCLVERDFGLVPQRNGTMDVSMWLTKDVCAGLFRCCGVHVLCMMTADARRPTMCRCKQADSADLRPFEARASSCELVVRHCARGHWPAF